MTVKLIETKKDSKDWKKIKALYLRAFPAVERLPFWLLKKKTQRRIAEFCSLYDDDEWVGFIYTLKNDSLAYVFFLAIDDTKRSHGYGSKLISLLTERYAGLVIGLSAERPDDQAENNKQRIRRQKFYQRNDFLHSGYYSVEKGGEKFDFLTYQGQKIDPDEYPKIMHECLGLFQRFILPVKMIADGSESNGQHS